MSDTTAPQAGHSASNPSFICPVCSISFSARRDLLRHLQQAADQPHKDLRCDAVASPLYPELCRLHIMICPLGCGALYDGGKNNRSAALESHVLAQTCTPLTTLSAPAASAAGPFLPTTMSEILTVRQAPAVTRQAGPSQPDPARDGTENCTGGRGSSLPPPLFRTQTRLIGALIILITH